MNVIGHTFSVKENKPNCKCGRSLPLYATISSDPRTRRAVDELICALLGEEIRFAGLRGFERQRIPRGAAARGGCHPAPPRCRRGSFIARRHASTERASDASPCGSLKRPGTNY